MNRPIVKRAGLLILLPLVALAMFAGSLAADGPLLMPGKKTLYQKVLSHPGAARYSAPGGQASEKITPFTLLYVYDRKLENGRPWLQVGTDTRGAARFWTPGEAVSDWKQALVLVFSARAGRQPLIFFKTKEDLIDIASKPNIANNLEDLALDFADFRDERQVPPDNFPVVAMEPDDEEGAVPYDRFYLLPIFNYDERFELAKLLEVGSIDPAIDPVSEAEYEERQGGQGGQKSKPPTDRPTTAIAFVIDTTISMGPYIEECRELSRRIYDGLVETGQGENIALGMVAFRSSDIATPDIEYVTKVISPLRTAMDRDEFEDALDQVREAKVSTHAFSEDSLAGLNTAINQLDWGPFQGRIILLLTDAGPLPLEDSFNSIPATPDTIYEKASEKNIRIVPIHIRTPAGTANHRSAEMAYRILAFAGGEVETYLSLDAPNADRGSENFNFAAEAIIDYMEKELFDDPKVSGAPPTPPADSSSLRQKAADIGAILGHSIRLDYLGTKNKAKAPRVVRSWISDKDLGNLDRQDPRQIRTVDVAVLLTKNQLSALARQLKIIVDNAEKVMSEQSEDFFKNILAASAQISRDPSEFSLKPNTKLGDLGLLGEFLDDLPYKSKIMNMTESDWYNMSPGEQDSFVRGVKARLAAYDGYDKDQENWAKFGQDPSDWLYRVPLTMLP
ncbi:MAG: VWA domain-containing protein [Deltaproteobacteria bacterium]|jgi:serine/threonine-protein kinase PpkA|nr:VWA domain-containing protein [Deltaproteobacteria bacterium]